MILLSCSATFMLLEYNARQDFVLKDMTSVEVTFHCVGVHATPYNKTQVRVTPFTTLEVKLGQRFLDNFELKGLVFGWHLSEPGVCILPVAFYPDLWIGEQLIGYQYVCDGTIRHSVEAWRPSRNFFWCWHRNLVWLVDLHGKAVSFNIHLLFIWWKIGTIWHHLWDKLFIPVVVHLWSVKRSKFSWQQEG